MKVVVDKLPYACDVCLFKGILISPEPMCILTKVALRARYLDIRHSRCPLVDLEGSIGGRE